MKKTLRMLVVAGLLAYAISTLGCGWQIEGGSSGGSSSGNGNGSDPCPGGAVAVDVSEANAAPGYDAADCDVTFLVHPIATFIYNIVNFAAGDELVFDENTVVTVTNPSGTDGNIQVVGTLNGQEVTVLLTGIAAADDGAISDANSFIDVFGPDSLVGVFPCDDAVDVTEANVAPGHDAADCDVTFSVAPSGTFTYNIVNFAAGDRLVFDDSSPAAIEVINLSAADGVIDVIGSVFETGRVATLRLTGIAAESDAAVFGVDSFNTVFGAGSLQ
jgi:hypothetical protein